MSMLLLGFVIGAAAGGFVAVFWKQLIGRGQDTIGRDDRDRR